MDKPILYGVHTNSFFVKHSVNTNRKELNEYMHFQYSFVFGFTNNLLQHTLNGSLIRTNTPFILFRAPFILHSCSTLDDQVYDRYLVSIGAGVTREFGGICDLARLRGLPGGIIPMTEEKMQSLHPILERLHRAYTDQEPKRVWISLLSLLLYEVNRFLPRDMPQTPQELSYIHEVLRYIVENIGEDLRAETLAQRFFISRNKLMQDFRSVTHGSVHEYIRIIRTAHAKNLLSEDLPISVFAQRCGYTYVSAFIRMFRAVEGMTPGEYRKSIREREPLPGIDRVENYRAAKNNP
ncbi:MAG: helix-turn-helix transcriptional regulator [Ruminococcaceae bacterium]|nr:helix-turn-helix transcriptional regulator [Oscillospiraceae bacterium]